MQTYTEDQNNFMLERMNHKECISELNKLFRLLDSLTERMRYFDEQAELSELESIQEKLGQIIDNFDV